MDLFETDTEVQSSDINQTEVNKQKSSEKGNYLAQHDVREGTSSCQFPQFPDPTDETVNFTPKSISKKVQISNMCLTNKHKSSEKVFTAKEVYKMLSKINSEIIQVWEEISEVKEDVLQENTKSSNVFINGTEPVGSSALTFDTDLPYLTDGQLKAAENKLNEPACLNLLRPKTGDTLCKECFYWAFELEIHSTITNGKLFKKGDVVAIAASGGKDSTVLAQVLKTLNERYNYELKLVLLSIDEGITGYRDDSLKTVLENKDEYQMPLKILSYEQLYGWSMDKIVAEVGRKNNCTFCGVFRRQALDRGATLLNVDCIATGHNADDIAETVLMNILRGDVARLQRCVNIITITEGTIPRCKPLKYTYEKEIVMYAYFKKLNYFSTECVFAPNAYRGYARTFLKDLERLKPSSIMDIIHSGETMCVKENVKLPDIGVCTKCGFVSSQDICKACMLLEGLNRGLPKLGIGKSSKANKALAALPSPRLLHF